MRLEEKLKKALNVSKSYIRHGTFPFLVAGVTFLGGISCGGGKKPTTPITNQNPTVEIKSGPENGITSDYDIELKWKGKDDKTSTDSLKYSYALAGRDTTWSDFSSATSVNYLDLEEDSSYTFKVQAKDLEGNSSEIAERDFMVHRGKIVFLNGSEYPRGITIINPNGSDMHSVPSDFNLLIYDGTSWMPNEQILFRGNDKNTEEEGIFAITPEGVLDLLIRYDSSGTIHPIFPIASKDGNIACFNYNFDYENKYGNIFVRYANGDTTTLTHSTSKDSSYAPYAWTPLGNLLFGMRSKENNLTKKSIGIMTNTGDIIEWILKNSDIDYYIDDCSSDGKKIVGTVGYYTPDDYISDIFIAEIDFSGFQKLTDSPYRNSQPKFSPDDKYIVYVSDEGDSGPYYYPDLYLMKISDRSTTNITLSYGFNKGNYYPDWK